MNANQYMLHAYSYIVINCITYNKTYFKVVTWGFHLSVRDAGEAGPCWVILPLKMILRRNLPISNS